MSSVLVDVTGAAPQRIASVRHTAIFIAIFLVMALYGLMHGLPGAADSAQHASETSQLTLYFSLIAMELGLFRFVAAGITAHGNSVASVIGCKLLERRGLLRDVAIGLALTCLSYGIQLGLDQLFPASDQRIFAAPTTALAIGSWLVLSCAAGVCEEFAFRGYLQTQLQRITKRVWISVLLQAALFGVGHAYQGVPAVARIMVFGLMFGIAATRCRTLRPLMLAHALTDVMAGLLAA